ncbi:MAG: ABC transporter substrate-binding protein [Betaproteobacteria bacterium]|nr:ABC transporter substrate-binding protein [Betaproteobacteria bacterium]
MNTLQCAARLATLLATAAVFSAQAADKVKIGLVTTLSGPAGAPGIDVRDGFNLAVKHLGGKLGGLPAEIMITDDQFNPESGKQIVDRFIKRDRVDIVTGIIYSNILLAAAPAAFEAKTPFISANAGPSQLAGKGCSPWFVSAAWQNDANHEAAGQHATNKGYKNAFLMAPNYPAGKDALTGFKRFYKGKVADEVYMKLGQLDFAAELAQLRAAKPEAVYVFMPGGMGINFVKQFVAAGLSKDMTLILPGFSADQDTIPAVGEPMLGIFNTSQWSPDMDNAENQRFVPEFEREYKRQPSLYASQGYDTALRIDAAVRAVKGKVEDREALMKALKTVKAKSTHGDYTINNNGFPIQNYYLRVIGKDAKGRITNKQLGTIFTNHADAYAKECALK